jgi:hypothetical protein
MEIREADNEMRSSFVRAYLFEQEWTEKKTNEDRQGNGHKRSVSIDGRTKSLQFFQGTSHEFDDKVSRTPGYSSRKKPDTP